MHQHRWSPRWRTPLALLTVLLLIATLIPILPPQQAEADADITLSSSVFPLGYPGTKITLTGGNMFPFHTGAQITLYNQSGQKVDAIADIQYLDNRRMSFTLKPGLIEGHYRLLVMSYETAIAEIHVMSSYDPTNVRVTPGADRDIRIDWTDPGAIDLREVIIQYGPINLTNYLHTVTVPRSQQTVTLRDLEHNKRYKIKLFTRKVDGTTSQGTEFTNNGAGYLAQDSTPPGELTSLVVRSIPNGFDLSWKDPVDPDLSLVTIQYAEHGTNRWSDGYVVAKGVEHAVLREMNTSKRYDFRFTKTDLFGNWSLQVATNNGYGYTFDTTPPSNVTSFSVSAPSKTSALLTWVDPSDSVSADLHHVKIYLRSALTDWISVGRVDKGVRQFTLNGLSGNIEYTFKVTAVDSFGNESSGVTVSRTIDTFSLTDLRNLTVSQESEGGLKLAWSETGTAINFNQFKVYYAPHGTTEFRETVLSNKSTRSAYLRDMPRGTYDLQFRLYDSKGVEQAFHLLDNGGHGFYVAGKSGGNYPAELGGVRIQPVDMKKMLLSWNPASTDGTHVEIYSAERSLSPVWKLVERVDKRIQRYEVSNLLLDRDYFFKLIVVDTNKNTSSYGIIFDNSGYGYNLTSGDIYPPHEVTNASASLSGNALTVSYFEPNDADFEKVMIYAQKLGGSEVKRFDAARGQGGMTIRDLTAGTTYTLRITTVDTSGNESQGVTLTNNGRGFTIPLGSGQAQNEVRNALLIPDTTKLTVRFTDPLSADYKQTVVALKKSTSSSYTSTKTVLKGNNEVTFDGLDPNSMYQVRITTLSTANTESAGVYLGGTTGIGLQPISKVTQANVTEQKGKLTVTWQDPVNTLPSGVQVEVQPRGSSVWSEPLIVQPGTGRAVFTGLSETESYKVRVTTLLNQVASTPVLLENSSSGYRPSPVELYANPSQITYDASLTQRISLLGVNTRFPYNNKEISAKLYTSNGEDVSTAITAQNTNSSTRYDLTLRRSLQPGLYKLVLSTFDDGEFISWIKVVDRAPLVQAVALDQAAMNSGYSSFTAKVTGTGFKTGAKVLIDGTTEVSPSSITSDSLSFTMPSGLLPGVHKVVVKTADGTSAPLGFTVHPFSAAVSYTAATTRSGLHKAEVRVKNHDNNIRNSKVLVMVRKNGKLIETKEFQATFSAFETVNFKLDFGGQNTVYADGPTNSLSIQAFVIDSYTATPLAETVNYYRTLNL